MSRGTKRSWAASRLSRVRGTPVRAIVELWRLGYSPEETVNELPHLSLAAVFDALSYYSDHKEEINGYIERNKVAASPRD